jgi:Zn-dependent peptidase ImmA (M78 family)/transcriptional regulator with XRE-family HTH domain
MPVSREELGRRLRQAREACGMTQEDVGKRFGLSRSTIAQMELGNREVTSLELDRLAYLFGKDVLHFLSEEVPEGDVMTVLFRAHPELRRDEPFLDSLRPTLAVGRELSNLEQLLEVEREVSVPTVYPLKAPKTRWDAIRQGTAVAVEERRRLDLGDDPIRDIDQVLEGAGVRTGEVPFPDDISGLTVEGPDVGILVAVNKGHPRIRQRFSFAHEYAHVLLDRDRPTVSRASERDDLREVRANAFAAAFLMPEEGVRRYVGALGKGRQSRGSADVYDEEEAIRAERRTPAGSQDLQIYDLVQVAHHFGVSEIAALYRIRNMRPSLVTETELERLKGMVDAGRSREIRAGLGLTDPEEYWRRREFRHRFLALALEAYRRERISRAKLLELARIVDVAQEKMESLIDESGIEPGRDSDAPQSGA